MQSLRSRAIYAFSMRSGSPFNSSSSITKQRSALDQQAKFIRLPARVAVEPISIDEMYAEWVKPNEVKNDGAVLYLHGGGFTMGSCTTHRSLAARIALSSKTPALLIDYRLAPENPYPAALEDAKSAYRWLLAQGTAARKIVLAGDSAGGGLVVSTAVALRGENTPLPGGIVCISPWADLTISGETMSTCADTDPLISREASIFHASLYAGQQDPASALISPIFADLSSLPPMLIQVGEYETLRSDSVSLAKNARQAGVEVTLEIWDRMWHVWHMFAGLMPESQRAIEKIGSFVCERKEASSDGFKSG